MSKILHILGYVAAGGFAIAITIVGYIYFVSASEYDKRWKTYSECLNEGYDRAQMTRSEHHSEDAWDGAYKSYARDCMIRQGYPSGKPY